MTELHGPDEAFKRLVVEQEKIQLTKFQGRTADEYDQGIFLGRHGGRIPETSEVEEFLISRLGKSAISLEGALERMASKSGGMVRWADMAGGRGLALRQMKLSPKLNGHIETTNVDINNYDLSGLETKELEHLEKKFPGITKDMVRPKFILANAETVQLPTPADLVTSIEAVQYLDHPIAALCNWYNQLKENGLMIVSTEHKWSGWIRYEGSALWTTLTPQIKYSKCCNKIRFLLPDHTSRFYQVENITEDQVESLTILLY